MHSYFQNKFDDDLRFFVHKYNLDKRNLGPWFKAEPVDLLDEQTTETKAAKEIKKIKKKHA